MLWYPVIMIQWIESSALSGAYFMLFTVSMFLKMVSFHHVMADNRYLKTRVEQVMKQNKDLPEDPKHLNEHLAHLFGI